MKKREFYDPDQKNMHFYSSHQERLDQHSDRYYQKLEENFKRGRKGRRMIFADLAIIVLIVIFFAFGRPYLLARESLSGCNAHVSLINLDTKKQQVNAFLKIKNRNAIEGDDIRVIAKYGTQELSFDLIIPEKGGLTGQGFVFKVEEDIDYVLVTLQIGGKEGQVKAVMDRLSFF